MALVPAFCRHEIPLCFGEGCQARSATLSHSMQLLFALYIAFIVVADGETVNTIDVDHLLQLWHLNSLTHCSQEVLDVVGCGCFMIRT